jgi:extradiol dioxygenase family protein
MKVLINIDVADLAQARELYATAFNLRSGRRFDGWAELVGSDAAICLLPHPEGSEAREAEFNQEGHDAIALPGAP